MQLNIVINFTDFQVSASMPIEQQRHIPGFSAAWDLDFDKIIFLCFTFFFCKMKIQGKIY